ncbi:MAG: pyrimidine operon attenuation protein, partial [Candidatus Magnetoglobus multicellularis str. Araruama]
FEEVIIPVGKLDISLHRDDLLLRPKQIEIKTSEIPVEIDNKTIIIVDDVLFTGRTIRAALDALGAWGRPQKIELAVLVDRGNRELPIQANFVGTTISTQPREKVSIDLSQENTVLITT